MKIHQRQEDALRVTPWNPSPNALARVKDKLPVPEVCPYCGSPVTAVENKKIYGRNFGQWPWAYLCTGTNNPVCDAYVGMHPFTNVPLGTLANKVTREARKKAKEVFEPLWQEEGRKMSRDKAYAWLAKQLGIEKSKCHIGWFDVDMCGRVLDVCKKD